MAIKEDDQELAISFEIDDKGFVHMPDGYAILKQGEEYDESLQDAYLGAAYANNINLGVEETNLVQGYQYKESDKLSREYVVDGLHDYNLKELAAVKQQAAVFKEQVQTNGKFHEALADELRQRSDESYATYTKYKPVALKFQPQLAELADDIRIIRYIKGDPLIDMPALTTYPQEFTPTGRYTEDPKKVIDGNSNPDFLWPEEKDLKHYLMMIQNEAFAWDDSECGCFKEEFFPPVKMPVIPHTPWVQKNIPIPPGIYNEVCKATCVKIDAGIYNLM
jgi:hypothetical protein